ncbi:SGNH hydrolase [Dacryopinax primogenitus]|uniref:SGNH hydrolase n=1 Tax=Dacryopinax primogenitus (strain DJM 731) TaxID=1858805 RepID=M5GGH0_DACPD|nr:SGNH hydrolase [Dacryopinax primogenitus]EJU05473.1 SGNH hydrolase [Dacryopinax primogenitus]
MAGNMDAIMLIGDSLTQGGWEPGGFAQRLAYRYARKMDVLNRGLSGYNTEWALEVFKQTFPRNDGGGGGQKVKLLIIWFGANDAVLPPKVQHSPLPKFKENMHTLISLLRSPSSAYHSPHTRLLLITPPPFSSLQRGSILASRTPPEPLDRDQAVTRAYAQAVRELGEEQAIPVVDMYTLLWEGAGGKEEGLDKWMQDGLHVNAAAYEVLYDHIVSTVKTHYPELHPDNLPFVFAPWDEMIRTTDVKGTLQSRYKNV